MDSDAMRSLLLANEPNLPEVMLARLTSQESLFELVQRLGNAFLPSFLPILNGRSSIMVTDAERRWQLLRRGRAVEFSLIVDRGTKFGLATPGIKAENIFITMPPKASWEYLSEMGNEEGTEETRLLEVLRSPRNWV